MSAATASKPAQKKESIVVRFAGDSGDGMQLVGGQFTNTSAVFGNDISTFPDFPAEIRAPAGTVPGVSGFQVHFSSHDIRTPGDIVDCLVCMNPAALKVALSTLRKGGICIVNSDSFGPNDLRKANYTVNPLDDKTLDEYMLVKVPMTKLTREAVGKETKLSTKEIDRCKNFFALGLVFWLYERPMTTTLKWINDKFAKNPDVQNANTKTLNAGHAFGETLELLPRVHVAPTQEIEPGTYRQVMGNQALAYGLVTAAKLAGKELFYGSYPITPASDILHELARLKHFGVKTFQAEDEIAAICSAIGAAFTGSLAATGTSGPGLALKAEAIGLAVMTELPLVVINVQRGGPSTGLPTKTEQADLLQAMYGRNGECPAPVIAAAHPSDCFWMAQEAFRIAVEYMTPVIFLTDGYIANGAEPWKLPTMEQLHTIKCQHPEPRDVNGDEDGNTNGDAASHGFLPYKRDEKNSRPWAVPGIKGYEHRIGGIEKKHETGNISYDPDNHQFMVDMRAKKVEGIANSIPLQTVEGPETGDLLVISWGGTFGSVNTAIKELQAKGKSVAHAHLRYLNPLPRNIGDLLKKYKQVLVPELNKGQLLMVLRSKFVIDAKGYNKVMGQPFMVHELIDVMETMLK